MVPRPFSMPVVALWTSESLLFFVCYVIAWRLDTDAGAEFGDEYGIARVGVIALAFIFGSYCADVRRKFRLRPTAVTFARILALLGGVLVCEAFINYTQPDLALPGSVLLAGTFGALVVLSVWHLVYAKTILKPGGFNREELVDSAVLRVFSITYYAAVVTLKSVRHRREARA